MKYILSITCLLLSMALTAQEDAALQNETNGARMEFSEATYDFDEIQQGDRVSHVFRFKNVGTEPLIIVTAKGSCGCTVPFYPKAPIMPGEESEIEVEFDSQGKSGMQNKKVSIVANTEPSVSVISIRGVVVVPEENETQEQLLDPNEEARATLENLDTECIALFPNPASETLQLELKQHIGHSAEVEIHNTKGTLVMQSAIDRISRETTRFDVSAFEAGIYIISIYIEAENKVLRQCFVVSRN